MAELVAIAADGAVTVALVYVAWQARGVGHRIDELADRLARLEDWFTRHLDRGGV